MPLESAVAAPKRPSVVLTEIQALRAIAVSLVVVFHLFPQAVTGGFVGVDAFFVISGFLITGHLLKEVVRGSRVALGKFWARRMRRLLPAAFLVLAASLVGMLLFLPSTTWVSMSREIGASGIYLQNWVLANNAVDYFAESDLVSPVQHYWSLSVEEQFYLVWPVLIALAVLCVRRPLTRRIRLRVFKSVVLGLAIAVFAASLAYSIHIARTNQSFGYFSTFSHAWEFAAGAVLAVLSPRLGVYFSGRFDAMRAAVAWVGYVLLIGSGFVFTGQTPFPGYTALLPVAGVLMVIGAGRPAAVWGPGRLAAIRPVQYLGDLSYSLYLWHWPLIVILPFAFERTLGTWELLGVLAASIVLAALTKLLIEDRARFGRLARARIGWTYAMTVVMSLSLVAACVISAQSVEREVAVAAAEVKVAIAADCFGAKSEFNTGCEPNHVVNPKYGPNFAKEDTDGDWIEANLPRNPGLCRGFSDLGRECRYGDPDSDTVIALFGDSHARHLMPPIMELAERNHWQVRLIWRSSCRPALPTYESPILNDNTPACKQWKADAIAHLLASPDIDLIVTSGAVNALALEMDGAQLETAAEAFAATWKEWTDAGKKVLVIQDLPVSVDANPPDCIARAGVVNDPCSLPRARSSPVDPMDLAAARPHSPLLTSLDMNPYFCSDTTCHFVVGGVITHYDVGHLTATMALTLQDPIGKAITAALAGPGVEPSGTAPASVDVPIPAGAHSGDSSPGDSSPGDSSPGGSAAGLTQAAPSAAAPGGPAPETFVTVPRMTVPSVPEQAVTVPSLTAPSASTSLPFGPLRQPSTGS